MKWLTCAEVGDLLHETPENVSRRCNAKQIAATKIGGKWLIRLDDFEAFMNKGRVPAVRVRSTADRKTA